MGMKTPNVRTKKPALMSMSLRSRNGLARVSREIGFGFGGCRDATVKFAMVRSPNIRNAAERIAHGKPTWGIRRLIMIGRMTPPRLEPLVAIPYAMPRFLSNHVATQAVAGNYQIRKDKNLGSWKSKVPGT